MRNWHRDDIFDALTKRDWEGPLPLQISPDDASYVGEAHVFRSKTGADLRLYFVADIGTGFAGPESIETVVAKPAGAELWLHRTRDSKWRRQLLFWANRVSSLATPEIREPNLPFRHDQATGDVILSRRSEPWGSFFEMAKGVLKNFLSERADQPPQKRKLFL